MKWGVRHYQNPDGTLTAEGKRHISKDSKKYAPNEDSDNLALTAAKRDKLSNELMRKYGNVYYAESGTKESAESKQAREKMEKEYESLERDFETLYNELNKKYENVITSGGVILQTGERYVGVTLTNKLGKKYVSEFYI